MIASKKQVSKIERKFAKGSIDPFSSFRVKIEF